MQSNQLTGAESLVRKFPIALIYRIGRGCKQYPFFTLAEVEKFCSRKPYSQEVLSVHAVGADHRLVDKCFMPAGEVVDYLKKFWS